ncbi:hypothetical protein [Pedococcus sp. 5OH_020]|uniref:hypothetical protein n=1 Tax=Pedococcus sp. 5OH_020 TaxID=2989814 RepID=UPI0022E9BC45|nr:hypothetical protein [Pedococcus sp. 5OH_020]
MGTSSHREVSDEELRVEIELLADLIDAATWSQCPLSEARIDQVLGLYESAA